MKSYIRSRKCRMFFLPVRKIKKKQSVLLMACLVWWRITMLKPWVLREASDPWVSLGITLSSWVTLRIALSPLITLWIS